jgi:hypothetical protein
MIYYLDPDALLQFCNVQRDSTTPSYLPYNPSDYDKTRQLSSDNTIVIWHETDTTLFILVWFERRILLDKVFL